MTTKQAVKQLNQNKRATLIEIAKALRIDRLLIWLNNRYSALVNRYRFSAAKRRAMRFHEEDGLQYKVLWQDGKYIIVSRESLKQHNKIAKKSNLYKHQTWFDVEKKALFSTPLKGRTQL